MARKFLTAIDLTQLELQNAKIQNLAAAPSTPVKGQIYYNTADDTLYWWNGTAWVPAKAGTTIAFGSVPAETTFGLARADGVAATAARSDHTHGSPAHSAAEHSTIPLSALAAATAAINMGGFVINNVGSPVAGTDAANKNYVDGAIAGLSWKTAVRVASAGNIATLSGLLVVDGVTLLAGDRVLVKDQGAAATNGIYIAGTGAWTRAPDMDVSAEFMSAAVVATEGSLFGDSGWTQTVGPPFTVGTTAQIWVQFMGVAAITAGAGLTQTANVFNVIGDATLTVGADTMGVADNGVTNTKLADMAAATIKGRAAGAGSGDPTDLTAAQVASVLVGLFTRKYSITIGNGSTTTVAVTHSLQTKDVVVAVYRSVDGVEMECDVTRQDTNNVVLGFAVAPATNEYTCVVIG